MHSIAHRNDHLNLNNRNFIKYQDEVVENGASLIRDGYKLLYNWSVIYKYNGSRRGLLPLFESLYLNLFSYLSYFNKMTVVYV